METTEHRPSRESRAFDSDQAASHPPVASYIRARAARADLSPDESTDDHVGRLMLGLTRTPPKTEPPKTEAPPEAEVPP